MLSLILPTYNEAKNLPILLPRIEQTLAAIPHEVIVVDDNSPDRTWAVAEGLRAGMPELRVIRRIGRRGLSSAVVEGCEAATGNVLAVMDADGQHDLALLPRLLEDVQRHHGIAVGSRYVAGGSTGAWDGWRKVASRWATRLAVRLCGINVHDPMSGFFALDRRVFDHARAGLHPKGFKILLDLLVHAPARVSVSEVPFVFGARLHGDSKLSLRVQMEFLLQLWSIVAERWLGAPFQYALFCLVFAAIAVPVSVRAWEVRLLTQAAVRDTVRQSLTAIVAREGWLLSDLSVEWITRDGMRVRYRQHHRGVDPRDCVDIVFVPFSSAPCAE